MDDQSSVTSAEDGGMSLGGHTYLPGTASLVQEIDSETIAVVVTIITISTMAKSYAITIHKF